MSVACIQCACGINRQQGRARHRIKLCDSTACVSVFQAQHMLARQGTKSMLDTSTKALHKSTCNYDVEERGGGLGGGMKVTAQEAELWGRACFAERLQRSPQLCMCECCEKQGAGWGMGGGGGRGFTTVENCKTATAVQARPASPITASLMKQ